MYDEWNKYITQPKYGFVKTSENCNIRDPLICVYGVPGSGKSRLLMTLSDRIEKRNQDILPVIVTFNDKCNYSIPTEREINDIDVWKALVCRIGFAIFGNNKKDGFSIVRNHVNRMNDKYFSKLTWEIVVHQIIAYVNKVKKRKYEGVLVLIDEILNTSKSKVDMHDEFLEIFRGGWDTDSLTRKELSLIFTTLNSYTWMTNESNDSKRKISTYFLPHFGDQTISILLAKLDRKIVAKALRCCVLVNFRPRYLRDVVQNFQNSKFENNGKCPVKGISGDTWDSINSDILINETIFNATFTNEIRFHTDEMLVGHNLGVLTTKGILIPYAKTGKHTFETAFVPQVSLIAILKYLINHKENGELTNLEEALLNMMLGELISDGDSFERFFLVFETFRFNAFVNKSATPTKIRDYFKNAIFCDSRNSIALENIQFKYKKDFVINRDLFGSLLEVLDKMKEKERHNYLVSNTFWFEDKPKQQPGFDGLIVFEIEKNERVWIFFEPRYKKPTAKLSEANLGDKPIGRKIKTFNALMSKHETKYAWFKQEQKLFIYLSYKDLNTKKRDKISKWPDTGNAAIWVESVSSKQAAHSIKFGVTSHFGPTWSNLLSHWIGIRYHHTCRAARLIDNENKNENKTKDCDVYAHERDLQMPDKPKVSVHVFCIFELFSLSLFVFLFLFFVFSGTTSNNTSNF